MRTRRGVFARYLAAAVWVSLAGCWAGQVLGDTTARVIAYCAQDQVFAEPIFQQFEKQTGIKVLAVYDNEAVKTVGLANRLLAERGHPVCDLFWGNEEMRTRQLASRDVFRPTNGWSAFGYRTRRVVINTNLLPSSAAPRNLFDLTNAVWRGKLALAYPQFGTTATHFHVLRERWGDPVWRQWCQALVANKPLLVDGNSEVVKSVARGDAEIGLTDSDDIANARREGSPVAALPLFSQSLIIPNTVAVIRGAPDPQAAEKLFDYLKSPAVVAELVRVGAIEGASAEGLGSASQTPDWSNILRNVQGTTRELDRLFLR